MKSAYAIMAYPQTFNAQREWVGGFVLIVRPSFLDAAVELIKDIPTVSAVRIIGAQPPPVLTPEQQAQEDRDTIYKDLHEKPREVVVTGVIGNLVEDVFEDVRAGLDTLASQLGEQHDPTEVVLQEVANRRAIQRSERMKRSSLGASTPIAPATAQRRRINQ